MIIKHLILPAILLLASAAHAQSRPGVLKYVDPLIGTAAGTTISAMKHGTANEAERSANVIPSVGLPFAMTQWVAQTRSKETKCVPPYLFKDDKLNGFRGTHWLSGSCVPDYGSFTIIPVTGKLNTKTSSIAIPFSHKDEITHPDYYAVTLPSAHLKAELSATLRCGIFKFTMLQDDSLYILATANSDKGKAMAKFNRATNELSGYNPAYRIYQGNGKAAGFSGYFVVQVQKTMETAGTFSDGINYQSDSIINKKDLGAYMGFKLKKGETLTLRIGTSFTSIAEARKNLQAELPSWDLTAVRQKAAAAWEQALQKIQVTDANEKNKRIFYTSLYHSMVMPRLYNDADGTYPKFSQQYQLDHLPAGTNYYDDFTLWDTFRANLPLLEIIQPKLVNNLVRSMILKGQQGGYIPIFPCWNSYTSAMIGDHVSPFIASAYLRGIKDYDVAEAYRLLRQNAFDTPSEADYLDGKGRRALSSYLKYGYIPLEDPVKDAPHQKEQVSRTLEYAFDDYALALLAKSLNHIDDYDKLMKRAANYKNVIDPATGMARGRHEDGTWITPFYSDKKTSYITEGTPRQYTFYAPQDVPGLAALMGGKNKLEVALDSIFTTGEYWHGNEPGHQIPYMYNFTNAPWKTQQEVTRILKEEYSEGPGGMSGNDDSGQMSAWYVFSALGFYPLDPVAGQYQLCTPMFKHTSLNLEGGKKFVIDVIKPTSAPAYIKTMKLNGKAYKNTYITYADLAKGGRLEITLADKPNLSQKN